MLRSIHTFGESGHRVADGSFLLLSHVRILHRTILHKCSPRMDELRIINSSTPALPVFALLATLHPSPLPRSLADTWW